MPGLINSFKDFYFVYLYFRIKKLLLIFSLFTLCTILETLNIAIILPLVSFIFGDQNNIESLKILSFLDLKNIFQNNNFIYYISFLVIILFGIKSIILIISNKIQTNFFAQIRYKISNFFF